MNALTSRFHASNRDAGNLPLIGGNPTLDFVNTVECRSNESDPREWISDYLALLRWCRHAGLIEPGVLAELAEAAERSGDEADTVAREARRLREHIRAAILEVCDPEPAGEADVSMINLWMSRAEPRITLTSAAGACWMDATSEPTPLDLVLVVLAWHAAILLSGPEAQRVKQCSAPDCDWMFIDRSPKGNRAWCSMQECGNRVKQRRFKARAKGSRSKR